MNSPIALDIAARSGFRDLKVVAKVRESSIISSFHLEPVDPDGWHAFQPGQFLVFRIPVTGERKFVLRNYSISCSPSCKGSYRITVKREAAPTPGIPNGLSSCYLHDDIEVGDLLEAAGPRGDFVLDRSSKRPVVLLSGGVGLTPMVSMLQELAVGTERQVFFIHACENGDVHALRDEVNELAASRAGVDVHFCYRSPTERDTAAGRHHSEGIISRELLQSLLPLDDYDIYLCGPPPFMQAVYRIICDLGVPKHRIAYEFFGPGTVLEPRPASTPSRPVPAESLAGAVTVEFRKSGLKAVWDGKAESLLAFAEEQGLSLDFSCRAGICGACKSHLLVGEVVYFEEPLEELGDGEVLLCCSKPQGPIVIDS